MKTYKNKKTNKEFIKPSGSKIGYITYINEESIGVKYDGVSTKNARPYLFYKSNFLSNKNYFIPITDKFNQNNEEKKNKFWIEIKLQKDSFIKVNKTLVLSLKVTNDFIKQNKIQITNKISKDLFKEINKKIKDFKKIS